MGADQVDCEDEFRHYCATGFSKHRLDMIHVETAKEDLSYTNKYLRRGATRRACLEQPLPLEVWHMPTMPDRRRRRLKLDGIGTTTATWSAPFFRARRTSFTPLGGDRSTGYVLDKPGAGSKGKEACKRKRIAHVRCPFSKARHAGLLARGPTPELPPSDHGFATGRWREGAMSVTLAATYKLGKAGISLAEELLDMTTAFQCGLWQEQNETPRRLSREEDVELYATRYWMGSVHLLDVEGGHD